MVLDIMAVLTTLLTTLFFTLIVYFKGAINYHRYRFIKIFVCYILIAISLVTIVMSNDVKSLMVDRCLEYVELVLPYVGISAVFTIYYNKFIRLSRRAHRRGIYPVKHENERAAHFVLSTYLGFQVALSLVTLA